MSMMMNKTTNKNIALVEIIIKQVEEGAEGGNGKRETVPVIEDCEEVELRDLPADLLDRIDAHGLDA